MSGFGGLHKLAAGSGGWGTFYVGVEQADQLHFSLPTDEGIADSGLTLNGHYQQRVMYLFTVPLR
jgi:hypothetical protein